MFIRCEPRQLLFPLCSALLNSRCRKCKALRHSSTVSLSASVFLLCFPSPPYTSVSHRAEKKAYPALIALMPAPHPPTTKFAPSFKVWELRTVLWNQQSPSHVHVCTGPTFCSGAAEQEKQLWICPSPGLHFWGWGESRSVAAVVLGVLFLASSRPSTTTAVSLLLLLLWQSRVRNSLSLCTSQN